MNILIIGAGAIGGYLGGKLAAQHNVTIYDRARLVDAIRARGLHLIEPEGEATVTNLSAFTSLEEVFAHTPRFDLALCCVKAYDTAEAIAPLRPYTDRIERWLTPQNGVANEELLGQLFGREKVIAGTVLNPISIPEIGAVRLEMRKGGLGLAPIEPAHPIGPVVDAIGSIGLPLRVYADYRGMKWSKLLLNLLGNATSAILDMNTLEAFADQRVFAIEVAALREAIAVMDALKVKAVNLPGYPVPLLVLALRYLPLAVLQPVLRRMAKSGRGAKLPSLLIDLNAGRPKSEIDDLNGAVSAASQSSGVKTPVNDALTATVRDLVAGKSDRAAWRRQIDRLVTLTSR
ncbi:MAG: ketopantoate reductase family protein [Thermoflexales bacterium]|nr:ketopantoate reductase family protein [Thermoflexales bacterium]